MEKFIKIYKNLKIMKINSNFFDNKIVLITGASRGIGKAILQQFAQNNATVIGTATSDSGAGTISQYLQQNNFKGCGVKLDVADSQNIQTVIDFISKNYGNISILVNNAGITQDNLFMRMSDEQWDNVINTNLSPIFKLCKSVVRPMMKERFGRIINISSVVAFSGNAGQANYCAAKAGVIGLTKSLARELGSRNITVNAVAPGFIATDMTNKLSEEQRAEMVKNIPLGRAGTPDDIADAVIFLASENAAYITGTTIHCNGGMYI